MLELRLIETDDFPFEFLSQIGERESWRKEIHRPVYHVHKWWAKRLGSVFRGILLGSSLGVEADLRAAFYERHRFAGVRVFDPFMGSGTTVGEAHKLGFTAFGRDINPVAANAVRVALGPMSRAPLDAAFAELDGGVGERIRELYKSVDSDGRPCDVLYFFWVMQAECPACNEAVDLFSSRVFAQNAYPKRKPEVQIVCPECGDIFEGVHGEHQAQCPTCCQKFDQARGNARGQRAVCRKCHHDFQIIKAIGLRKGRPDFRLYAKLILRRDGTKQYLKATGADLEAASAASALMRTEGARGAIRLPSLNLADGYNTRQAMSYRFGNWQDFFSDRQLLALGWLQAGIEDLTDPTARGPLLTLFSGMLEFNNLFASYKGEGTGAVRHMFSHHILKPERTPIEANVWGTTKSSGSFSGLYRGRLARALAYREHPTEVNGTKSDKGLVCSPAFTGVVEGWPTGGRFADRAIYLSCGDSASTGLDGGCIDLVVTDPPFFDNVHYSELADFFYAWERPAEEDSSPDPGTTRRANEVQDADPAAFAGKLRDVFRECNRVLRDDGLLVFTYHHSRDEGWTALAEAVLGSGFLVVNSQPVKAEMSVATPKAQAKDPIQLDIILVCRKAASREYRPYSVARARESAREKVARLTRAGFDLSKNDRRLVIIGQLLACLTKIEDAAGLIRSAEGMEAEIGPSPRPAIASRLLPGF